MCHHARIKADYQDFFREHGAIISLKRFSELFWKKGETMATGPRSRRLSARHSGVCATRTNSI
jgi:hypothetical protein